MRQATVLLVCGGAIPTSRCTLSKFVGLRQPEMIRQQSCRAGFNLPACVDLAPVCRPCRACVFCSWVAEGETAGSECRCLAPQLRVREFTDDVISRVHLHLCLLDVRFITHSSGKVDAQIHSCCCVWESGTVPHYIQFSFGFPVPLVESTHLCLCRVRTQLVSVVVGGHSAQGRREWRFDVVEVISLRRDAQVGCVDEAASVGVYGLVVGVVVEQHRWLYTSLW